MSAATKAMQMPASVLGAQADAMLEHVRTGETVELTANGRAIALVLPIGTASDRSALERRMGSPALRGLARYASEEDLFSTGESWEADR